MAGWFGGISGSMDMWMEKVDYPQGFRVGAPGGRLVLAKALWSGIAKQAGRG